MIAAKCDEAPNRANDRGPKEEISNLDSLTTDAERKAFATLEAQFAIGGYAVHTASDGFIVANWNLTRHVPDLRSLSGLAQRLGVRQ